MFKDNNATIVADRLFREHKRWHRVRFCAKCIAGGAMLIALVLLVFAFPRPASAQTDQLMMVQVGEKYDVSLYVCDTEDLVRAILRVTIERGIEVARDVQTMLVFMPSDIYLGESACGLLLGIIRVEHLVDVVMTPAGPISVVRVSQKATGNIYWALLDNPVLAED